MNDTVRALSPERCGWLAGFEPDARRFNELLDDRGEVRAHWSALAARLAMEPPAAAQRRFALTQRLIAENGVTYNIYADPRGADRPWALDPLPLILPPGEWREIEEGVLQRLRILDGLLADLYGPQRLIAEGVIPGALAYGHPNFLWPCRGVEPAENQWLHVYAADLARGANGRWRLLADRTQAPSGAGYALENREILEQVMPDALRELRVRRVSDCFEQFRERLLSFGAGSERPLAVVLTPGPYNETYFEHAYLARRLGLTLAEGHDLTVRGEVVYLKTLGGLRRVHTIYRRLDDDYCDPVELRGDSALGVPGLLNAVRAGQVVLANALGSGVLESAAWLGFLPGVAARLTGESLRLPSLATWWCGEAPSLEYVLANLERMVIKPTYPNQRFEPLFGRELSSQARERLVARLRARPYAYVAQERLSLSQAPVQRSDGGVAARPLALRVYAIATAQGPVVMPGGLARVATDGAIDVVSSQRGGGSKDVWVAPASERGEPLPPVRTERLALSVAEDLPSRLVENLFWFGRYSVRCEDKAQLLRATLAARADEDVWRAVSALYRALGAASAEDPAAWLAHAHHPASVPADVRRLGWCAAQVRSRLSSSFWRASVDLQRQLQEALARASAPGEALDRLLLSLAALVGYAFDHMTRDGGWRLMRIGRRLERLELLTSLLGAHLGSCTAENPLQIEWLLSACDSTLVYRSRYACAPRLGPLLDLLLRDAEHPRAVGFQQQAIEQDLAALAAALGGGELRLEQRAPTLSDDDLLQIERDPAARLALRERLAALSVAAEALSDRISMRHFSHVEREAQALAV